MKISILKNNKNFSLSESKIKKQIVNKRITKNNNNLKSLFTKINNKINLIK
jgi:hypothetical protein